jgi:hypothetical protein
MFGWEQDARPDGDSTIEAVPAPVPAEGEVAMTERPHESEDLEDYEVLDSSDTLAGPPGTDPLDRGVATPERWSRSVRSGGIEEDESLDELLAEEEPDVDSEYVDDDDPELDELDENAPGNDVRRSLRADGPDQRAGRLVSEYDDDESMDVDDGEAVGLDAGIDSGGATAEEAAVHVLGGDDDSEPTGEEQ